MIIKKDFIGTVHIVSGILTGIVSIYYFVCGGIWLCLFALLVSIGNLALVKYKTKEY